MASPDEISAEISRAKDTAQAVVTALLSGDRELAGSLAENYMHPLALALVLADLTASVHTAWSTAVGQDQPATLESWRMFLLDITVWREEHG